MGGWALTLERLTLELTPPLTPHVDFRKFQPFMKGEGMVY